ncbi:MAG: DUF1802 family protein [Cyanobacteria bacterium J06649_4]
MSVNSLTTGLWLPPLDIAALLQGRMIVAMTHTFRNPLQFMLCPLRPDANAVYSLDQYSYSFLRSVPKPIATSENITVTAWAKFGACRIYNKSHDLEALSHHTVWTTGYLQELMQMQHKLFLMTVQVYRFEQPIQLNMRAASSANLGQYIALPDAFSNRNASPVIAQSTFARRQQQLFDFTPPSHPELAVLQADLATLRENGLGAMLLDRDLRYLLGWSRLEETQLCNSDLVWIRKIARLGHSIDTYSFVRVVNRALTRLGFHTVEASATENAISALGSEAVPLDINFQAPFALIGDCRACYFASDAMPERLKQLGKRCLTATAFAQAVKVVFAARPMTVHANEAAIENGINIMRPETLQRLTELQVQHPGSIDLLKLKPCLSASPFGEDADDKVNHFIDGIVQQLAVRAELISAVKTCLNETGEKRVGADAVFFLYAADATQKGLPQLSRMEVQEALIELSSPLAGYLGREKDRETEDIANSACGDRFYFLRELHIEHSSLSKETFS